MAKRAPASKRQSTTIARGNVPVAPNLVPPPPSEPRDVQPEEEQAVINRGTLMALVYAQVGSYAKVAEVFQVAESTVRWWVHETRKRRKDELLRIADQLRGDVAQLAVDRVQEGLLEGDTEFAAELGRKVLHGLGELRSHSSIKSDGPSAVTSLTLNIVRDPDRDPAKGSPEVVEGAVIGKPYALDAAQTSAEDDE